MADTNSVSYHFDHLDDGGSAIESAQSRLMQILEDVNSKTAPLGDPENFGQETSTAYKVRKDAWDKSAEAIVRTLDSLQKAVRESMHMMKAADRRNAALFE